MKVRFLLSTQRSGSHFLKSFIETHFANVICSGETLENPFSPAHQAPTLSTHPEVLHFWPWYKREAADGNISGAPEKRIEAFEVYLTKLAALTAPRDLVIDTKYNSIRALSGCKDTEYGPEDFISFLTSRKIPVLHLIRKNILRTIISYKLARDTGVWHRTVERSSDEPLPKIRLNPKGVLLEIRYGIKLIQEYQSRFSGYPGYGEIIYEEFIQEQKYSEPGRNSRILARFLDKMPLVPSQKTLPFKKTTPEDPSEVVENWDEVAGLLQGTNHAWMAQTPLLAAA